MIIDSSLCVFLHHLRLILCEKPLRQWLHWYSFSPVFPYMAVHSDSEMSKRPYHAILQEISCYLDWSHIYTNFCKKPLSQWLHLCGLFPVCSLICEYKPLLYEKALLQCLDWYGFYPVCILICVLSTLIYEKVVLHWWQCYGYSPVYILKCVVRSIFCEKALLHWLHLYGFSPVCKLICELRALMF